eukprot:Rmarinus@m.13400
MDRPPSARGGGMGSSFPAYGAPPGTGQQMGPPGSSAGFRPGTGSRRPGSARRPPPTAQRLKTAQKRTDDAGQLVDTDVNVSDRPVTREGMTGLRTAVPGTAGGGRRFQDRTYYLGLLRNKMSEMTNEIESLQAEVERSDQDSFTQAQLQRKIDDLEKVVTDRRRLLATYNITLDKLRQKIDVAEIEELYHAAKSEKDTESRRTDDAFKARKQIDEKIRETNAKIEELYARREQRLNQLAPDARDRYQYLLEESKQLRGAAQQRHTELEALNAELARLDADLKLDVLKERASKLQEEMSVADEHVRKLKEELSAPRKSPQEMKQDLLGRVKDANAEISQTERSVQTVEEQIGKLHDRIRRIDQELDEGKDGNDAQKMEKFELLRKRDTQISSFLDEFEDRWAQDYAAVTQHQEDILQILEGYSRDLGAGAALPSNAQFEEMRAELEFKKEQLNRSTTTSATLHQELSLRQAELDRMAGLDERVAKDVATLEEEFKRLDEEIAVFSDIEKLKADSAATKKALEGALTGLQERDGHLKRVSHSVQFDFEKDQAELKQDAVGHNLELLEQKLRAHEEQIFFCKEYIASKGDEGNFGPLRDECIQLTGTINEMVVAQCQRQALQSAS